MYKHLLVPIDGTVLSNANVTAAVNLAKATGACISFFHAVPDFGSTSDGALMHAIDPDKFQEGHDGSQHAIVSKAVVTTRYQGVPCEGYSATTDRVAEAIVGAAQDLGCDLIVMASRGTKGVGAWLGASKTAKVLKLSPISLLVTRVEANEPMTAREQALAIIKDEHRALAVVMDAMRQMGQDIAAGQVAEGDGHMLQSMLDYVKAFPQRLHHPKEEQYLHPLLLRRCPESASVLVELERQHRHEAELVRAVEVALNDSRASQMVASPALVQAMEDLAEAVLQHMGKEEREVLPLAEQHLTEADWRRTADAFDENKNPEFADLDAEELRQLFVHIAKMTQEVSTT